MIVVVGQPIFRETESVPAADGLAARIALTAAGRGAIVQLVGKAGEDGEGDAVVLALAEGGVGHVALLREAGLRTPRLPARDSDESEPAADRAVPMEADGEPSQPSLIEQGGSALDSADVDLALRYLADFGVLVVADSSYPAIVWTSAEAAVRVGATLIVLQTPSTELVAGLPANAIVFEAPDADPDGVFATMVGTFAAALDDGDDPAMAFRSTVESTGWAPTPVE